MNGLGGRINVLRIYDRKPLFGAIISIDDQAEYRPEPNPAYRDIDGRGLQAQADPDVRPLCPSRPQLERLRDRFDLLLQVRARRSFI